MKATPAGWTRITSALFYQDAEAMIEWLCKAFGFEIRIKVVGDDGSILHSELTFGDGVIMVSGERSGNDARFGIDMKSPTSIRATTQSLMLYVDDVDAHCARSKSAGAIITAEPADYDYGEEHWTDRSYGARDPEDHVWWFSQRLRSPKG